MALLGSTLQWCQGKRIHHKDAQRLESWRWKIEFAGVPHRKWALPMWLTLVDSMGPMFGCSQHRDMVVMCCSHSDLTCYCVSVEESQTDGHPSFPILGLFVIEFMNASLFSRMTLISFDNSFASQNFWLKCGPGPLQVLQLFRKVSYCLLGVCLLLGKGHQADGLIVPLSVASGNTWVPCVLRWELR